MWAPPAPQQDHVARRTRGHEADGLFSSRQRREHEATTPRQPGRTLVIALPPTIDRVKTVGLIPGAMTGIIMGGASPLEAIQLQIVVENMLIAASTVSSILCTYLCWSSFFTKASQLQAKVLAD